MQGKEILKFHNEQFLRNFPRPENDEVIDIFNYVDISGKFSLPIKVERKEQNDKFNFMFLETFHKSN